MNNETERAYIEGSGFLPKLRYYSGLAFERLQENSIRLPGLRVEI
jgi:hypothetical protein